MSDAFTVEDSKTARRIMSRLGMASDPSLEPTMDWKRDEYAKVVATLRAIGWGPVSEARDKALEEAVKAAEAFKRDFNSPWREQFVAAIRALKGAGQ